MEMIVFLITLGLFFGLLFLCIGVIVGEIISRIHRYDNSRSIYPDMHDRRNRSINGTKEVHED